MLYSPRAIDLFVKFTKKHYEHLPCSRRPGSVFDRNITKIVELLISFGMPRQARQVIQTIDGRLSPEEFQALIEVVAESKDEAGKLLQDRETILGSNHYTILKRS